MGNGASMTKQYRIIIEFDDENRPEGAIREVLRLFDGGHTSGHTPHWRIEPTEQPEILYVFYECTNGITSEVLTTKDKNKADAWVNAFLAENKWESVEDYETNPIIGLEYELFETVVR